MRARLLALIALVAVAPVCATYAAKPTGFNCNVGIPPPSSGEEFNHGIVLTIHPRARDITPRYTGCQIMWMPQGEKWAVVSITVIEKGDPVRIWSPDATGREQFACRYARGAVVSGPADKCAAPEYLIVKSLAPGCVEKMKAAVATRGLGAGALPGCDYE